MADELYQEFFLALCETTDNRLVMAYEGKYLDVLCVGIINNIWGKRNRVKTYANGTTHPLYEVSSSTIPITNRDQDLPNEKKVKDWYIRESHIPSEPEYDVVKDIRSETAIDHMKELVQIAMDSQDQSERFRARVFHYSRFKYKNTRQFAKASGIPYNVCLEAYNNFKEKIKSVQLCRIS